MPRARLATLLALAALCALPGTAGAVLSGVNGRIMFASGREVSDATAGLYMRTIVGSVGGGQVFPAAAPVGGEQHRHPSWSPDRTKVVYARGPSGDWNIHIKDLTNQSVTGITSTVDSVFSDRPAWSPDGTKIAWEDEVTNNSNQMDIIVYDVATGTKTNITQTNSIIEGKPAWSPDSQTIYYHRSGSPATNLNIVSRPAAGGAESGLVVPDSSFSEFQPSISPDGTKICFTLQNPTNTGTADIFVAPLATPASQTRLDNDNVGTMPQHGDYNCTWSPDGRFVAYVRGTFNLGDLVMEHADDSDLTPIVLEETMNRFDGNPDWAPDGPPECDDTKTQQVRQGKSITVRLPCHDTGPAYERTDVQETVPGDAGPFHGTVGTVKQGNPATVKYTANAKYSGPDTFEFAGIGINGGSDRGLGTIAGDRLLGLGAKDRLRGFKGNDCLFGGAGGDTLEGGPDKDRLKGDRGKDILRGGGANDSLDGGNDKDRFDGGRGNDRINSADGVKEDVKCGAGKDDRATADQDDTLHGCEHVTRK
jgi:Tol biopolymer transport system component